MQTTESLLRKFWNGETTPAENAQLQKWLTDGSPDWEEYLASGYPFPEADVAKSSRGGVKENNRRHEILQQIHARIDLPGNSITGRAVHAAGAYRPGPAEVRILPRRAFWWAAAAILLLSGSYLFVQQRSVRKAGMPGEMSAVTNEPVKQRKLRQISNSGARTMELHLEDGSLVQLASYSAITYYEPFDRSAREISLKGQAYFKVAKDPSRAFTVYANDVATTALGTSFSVNTLADDKVAVKLFEGKVVVRLRNGAAGSSVMKDVYLDPGQACTMDKRLQQSVVTGDGKTRDGKIHAGAHTEQHILAFNRESLSSVFQTISRQYKIRLAYDQPEMEKLRFTGKFTFPSDSLSTVLGVICNMSELRFDRQNDRITITKSN